MNRKIAPKYHQIENINFIEPNIEQMPNGLQIASFLSGTQDVLKITLVFEAGTCYGESTIIPTLTNLMLREGTSKYTSEQIADKFDFYGTHISLSTDKDVSQITLYTLTKHIEPTLDILSEMVFNPIFPQEKLDILVQKQKQKYQQNIEKVKYLANQKFTKELYENHPYGRTLSEKDFSPVSRNDLQAFFDQHYGLDRCKITVSGKYSLSTLQQIKEKFSFIRNTPNNPRVETLEIGVHPQKTFLIEKKDVMQSGLRIGKRLFNIHHPDYQELKIANTILGGYFGSRLMKNIREEKGYTYGIGSAIVSNQYSGFFTIVSEVNSVVSKQAIEEVRKEIKLLRTQYVGIEELEKVKSYMLGQLLKIVDGPFEMSDVFLNMWLQNYNWDYYRQFIKKIRDVRPEKVTELVEQYLHEDSMLYIIAGK